MKFNREMSCMLYDRRLENALRLKATVKFTVRLVTNIVFD